MAFLNRLWGRARAHEVDAVLIEGSEMLEVVGESYYQPALRQTVDSVGRETPALLMLEPDNQYDPNAIGVVVAGGKVGHLSREDAAAYAPGLSRLMAEHGKPIALNARIFGGEPGKPSFGIFLYHDPDDFGVRSRNRFKEREADAGGVDTGGSSAVGWSETLPSDRISAIAKLRKLLDVETDPIERHFMFNELEIVLYKCRDVFESALSEFEKTCERHHEEMPTIRPALMAEFEGMPRIPTYRQMAITKQKAHDYQAALEWAQRGLAMYGSDALRVEVVEDLEKRIAKYEEKLR